MVEPFKIILVCFDGKILCEVSHKNGYERVKKISKLFRRRRQIKTVTQRYWGFLSKVMKKKLSEVETKHTWLKVMGKTGKRMKRVKIITRISNEWMVKRKENVENEGN